MVSISYLENVNYIRRKTRKWGETCKEKEGEKVRGIGGRQKENKRKEGGKEKGRKRGTVLIFLPALIVTVRFNHITRLFSSF